MSEHSSLAGLAPKTPPQKTQKSKYEKTQLQCFFLRFFIVNHLVDYLNLTLNISMHCLNMNKWISKKSIKSRKKIIKKWKTLNPPKKLIKPKKPRWGFFSSLKPWFFPTLKKTHWLKKSAGIKDPNIPIQYNVILIKRKYPNLADEMNRNPTSMVCWL